jgi:hypothetical protein
MAAHCCLLTAGYCLVLSVQYFADINFRAPSLDRDAKLAAHSLHRTVHEVKSGTVRASMNVSVKLLLLGALLPAVAPFALADSSVVNVSGHDAFNGSSLTFITPFASNGNTGFVSSFSGGTVDYLLGTVDYMDSVSLLEVFTITNGSGDVLAFFDTGNNASSSIDSTTGFLDITLDETGYYTLNGGDPLAGYFNVTFDGNSANGQSAGTFAGSGEVTGPVDVAPEPPPSLLLGSALLAMASLFYIRRRIPKPIA